jgi:predicted metal-dependent phosphoesterase TrpH/glycosyltransferase involved in cell wall biosynthesis
VSSSERFAIAQVSPYPWDAHREVNLYVERLSDELCARGHRVVVIAPAESRELVRESRALVRRLADEPEALWARPGCAQVIALGHGLPFPPTRRGSSASLPLDLSRTLEDLLERAELDFVHVHEPFSPSAASAALRHSRALTVGTFHSAAERVVSTQLGRRLTELRFGRLDGRTASFRATAELVGRYFPGDYRVIPPGADLAERPARADDELVEILFSTEEERGALRTFLRALRRLPGGLPWRATVWSRSSDGRPPSGLSKKIRDRIHFAGPEHGSEAQHLARAHVAVAASSGVAPAPQLVVRALAGGAVPVATRLPEYEELLRDGDLGLLFDPRDADTLAGQLERLVVEGELRRDLHDRIAARHEELGWSAVTDRFEELYSEIAARRHPPEGKPAVRRLLEERPLIDVDLHMHTNHSPDCATPVETLLETARQRGLGAIAVTDHNEITGALEARELANRDGDGVPKVIVSEEVKTADQGEVIALFVEEKIERGMTLPETIAEIRRQGGLVYVPHPFDRMHTVAGYEDLLTIVAEIDAIEVFNAKVAYSGFNEEAARFAEKYRIVAGAGSDSHVAQGLGSVRIRMRDFEGPEEFLESLRAADIVRRRQSLLYVHALKFIQQRGSGRGARGRADRAVGASKE